MTKSLILAGGCFWCVEHDMRTADGVVSVVSGYAGGESTNPTYENHTGHREVVLVEYDDTKTSFKKLVQYFLDHIDPTDDGGQFADRGESYKTGIFFDSEEEERVAQALLAELDESHVYDRPVTVEVLPRKTFYKAEEYHQDYAEKNPMHYSIYRQGSGREGFVQKTCAIRDEKHIPWKD
jgi:methionine-S-sulfoxide reductase